MSKVSYAALEAYFEQGIDLRNRRIYFGDPDSTNGDEVEFGTIEIVLRAIDKLYDMNRKPIEIHMSSYGGDPYMMLALYDKIQETPCKFIFYGRGMIMSAATWIMCGCDERYLSANSRVMVHDGSIAIEGTHTDTQITAAEEQRLQDHLNQVYADNSFLDKKSWDIFTQRDLYLSPVETLALGLVDGVLAPAKRGNFRKGPREATFKKKPYKRRLSKLLTELGERIKRKDLTDVTVSIKEEEFGEYEDFDHTEEEMKSLGLTTPSKKEPEQKSVEGKTDDVVE